MEMNTDQITAEAAENIRHREYLNAPDADNAEIIAIIKSAIEKAFNEGHKQGMDDEAMHWIQGKNQLTQDAELGDIKRGIDQDIERLKYRLEEYFRKVDSARQSPLLNATGNVTLIDSARQS
jgi:hypothetical protein